MNPSEPVKCACGAIGTMTFDEHKIMLDCRSCGNHFEMSTPSFRIWEEEKSTPNGWADLMKKAESLFPSGVQMFRRGDDRCLVTDRRDVIEALVCDNVFKGSEVYKSKMYLNCSTHGQAVNKSDYAFSITVTIHDSDYADLIGIVDACIKNGWGEALVTALVECGAYESEAGKQKPVEVNVAFLHNNEIDNNFAWGE